MKCTSEEGFISVFYITRTAGLHLLIQVYQAWLSFVIIYQGYFKKSIQFSVCSWHHKHIGSLA